MELNPRCFSAPPTGIEPVTFRLTTERSILPSSGGVLRRREDHPRACGFISSGNLSKNTFTKPLQRRVEDSNLCPTFRPNPR